MPGDRRLLGALVRPVPPGRPDRRADRGDAPGRLQGRQGQHRRGAAARAASTTCRASRSSACSATVASSARRSGPSPARSSKPSSECSSSPDPQTVPGVPSRVRPITADDSVPLRVELAHERVGARRVRPRAAGRPTSARRRAAAARRRASPFQSTESLDERVVALRAARDHAGGEQRRGRRRSPAPRGRRRRRRARTPPSSSRRWPSSPKPVTSVAACTASPSASAASRAPALSVVITWIAVGDDVRVARRRA